MDNASFYRAWHTICWFLYGKDNTSLNQFNLYDRMITKEKSVNGTIQ